MNPRASSGPWANVIKQFILQIPQSEISQKCGIFTKNVKFPQTKHPDAIYTNLSNEEFLKCENPRHYIFVLFVYALACVYKNTSL
jgi:hypothetical protein